MIRGVCQQSGECPKLSVSDSLLPVGRKGAVKGPAAAAAEAARRFSPCRDFKLGLSVLVKRFDCKV